MNKSTGKEPQLEFPRRSKRNSKQKDDDCLSEDSFGSDFDNATDEENLKDDTELDSAPPVYSEEERPQSISLSANMDVKKSAPTVLQYTGSTELEPALNVTPNLSDPLMCVVGGLISNPTFISINLYVRSARLHPPIVTMEFPIRPAGHLTVHPKCERFLLP